MSNDNNELVQVKDYSVEIVGQDVADVLEQIEEYYRAAQYTQAKRMCEEILQYDPENVLALKHLGVISHRLNDLQDALDCFNTLTELEPDNDSGFYNLGHTCVMMGNLDLAFAAFSKTIELNPEHARAYNNLGVILERRGDFEQAVGYFYDAGELDENHALSRLHLVHALLYLHRLDECRDVIEESLKVTSLSPDQRGNLLVDRAVIAWLQADIDVCQRILRLCKHVLNHMQQPEVYAQPYISFVIDLLEYRLKHPDKYDGKFDREIYYLGDQQCLAASDTVIEFDDMRYRMLSYLVADARISDFNDNETSQTKVSFEAAIGDIPKKSIVLCGFGEIDCHATKGIYEYVKQNKINLDEYMQTISQEYIQFVKKCCEPKNIKAIIVGIPACNEDIQELSTKDQQKVLYIIEQLNEFVAEAALAAGQSYLDVYTATVGDNGRSNHQFHLNAHYLTPDALQSVFSQYLLTEQNSQ